MPARLTQEQFLSRAKALLPDYDFTKALYTTLEQKVEVSCPLHGAFLVKPRELFFGSKCPVCKHVQIGKSRIASTKNKFWAEVHKNHGTRYEYLSEYEGAFCSLRIVCKEHGEFIQQAHNHRKGHGCPACGYAALSALRSGKAESKTWDRIKQVHGEKYRYKTSYSSLAEPLEIECPVHGVFFQAPSNHRKGHGCPACAKINTAPERELREFLESLGLVAGKERTLPGSRLRVDIPVDELGLAIEYHGLYWHGTGNPKALRVLEKYGGQRQWQMRHKLKRLACEAAGLRYIAFYEDEWLYRRELCESYLRMLCGKAPRLMARKLQLVEVPASEARAFYDQHHWLRAGACGSVHLGLRDADGKLRAVMSGGPCMEKRGTRSEAGIWSLARFCTDGCSITGGASRLFRELERRAREGGAGKIISYVDLDKYTGGVYATLGFSVVEDIDPDYWTVWKEDGQLVRKHKTATKRCHLARMEGFREEETEFENCQRMGIYRIYHSGRQRVEKVL